MIDNFRYEDVETLTQVEQPCLTALFLQSDLALLRLYAEHKSTPAENTAATLVEIVDCLERLFDSLKEESTRLALREVHATAGRKVRFAEGWYGSYCEAARAAGRMYYRAIYAAADPDEYAEWILADSPNSPVPRPLPAATIEARWSEIAQAILGLPTVDWDELDLGIRNEWIEVRGNRSNGDGNGDDPPECYVSLLQMASIVQKSKSTLRRFYDDGGLPPPKIEGGGGSPHEWVWSDVRPILETKYSRILPVAFPSDRFVKH